MTDYTAEQIAAAVDLACLKPTAEKEDVALCCQKAIRYGCASVCVKPCHITLAAQILAGYPVKVGTVIGFPHGHDTPHVKQAACRQAIAMGAKEVDMVLNIATILERDWGVTADEVRLAAQVCRPTGVLLKTILETCYLDDSLIIGAAGLAARYGADFVKTSTGFGSGNATPEAVTLMLRAVKDLPHLCQVKASGGIATYEDARKFLDLGCTRLGASKIEELLPEFAEVYTGRGGY